jgi:hypothetical protein
MVTWEVSAMKARVLLGALPATILIGLTVAVLVPGESGADVWQVPLEVENGAAERDTIGFGIHPDGTAGVDPGLGEVGLPPWPPGSLYEVRFMVEGCEGLKLDIRDTTHTQRLHNIRWQAGAGGYPVVIRWDRFSLPFATLFISDAYGGLFIPPTNMYEADSILVPSEWSFITEMTLDVTPGESPGAYPVIDEVPDAEVFEGQQFPEYTLDDYVFDPDTPDSLLVWFVTDNESPLVLEVDGDRILRITAPEGWTGVETVTLIARDPELHTDETYVTFTVRAGGLPAWTVPLSVENGAAETRTAHFGIHPDASDGIDPAMGEVSLPPWPPSDAFDVRFQLPDGFTWSVRDIRLSSPDTISYYLAWQAGDGGYPVTVTWDPAAIPAGTFLLSDDKGGIYVDSLDMRDTSEVVFPPEQAIVTGVRINALAVVDTVPPLGPLSLTVNDWVNGEWITLDWSACTEDHFAYYEILYDTLYFYTHAGHVWDWTEDPALTQIGTTSTTITLFGPSDFYGFRIRAWDTFGNAGILSDMASPDWSGAPDNPQSEMPRGPALAVRPNPIGGEGRILYALPSGGEGSISIFDVSGRRIREIGIEAAGRGEAIWDGRDSQGERVSPGIYFVTLETQGRKATQKVVLVR